MSNLIKSTNYISLEDKKKLKLSITYKEDLTQIEETEQNIEEDAEILSIRDEILKEAQAIASEQIEKAKTEVAAIKAEAENEIKLWWSEKREKDEDIVQETKAKAVEQGIKEGTEHAVEQVKQQYSDLINEASSIVNTAYKEKEKIIQEAEPFLVDLSCAIAEKVIHKELHDSKETVIQMISKVLTRRNEEGIIKCCVAPDQYKYIKDAKEELLLSLDPQAELQIVPDASLSGFDCVVHSSFGSIDAKIDTQLSEIKNQLNEITRKRDEHDG
ncbi:FliH/SctL family protein [Chengkuizengella sediminis]|uniref:FliH/SctL family protein n=1 Tax=Chengkuizengella sediminis TaxID=1885917 RepID=UPI00138A1495|nr:FliH/SctL family protein [Chengkuizengella sediminis]NDI33391.1 flagellar assembly protein FliH [Chengkuizengella sediminis]